MRLLETYKRRLEGGNAATTGYHSLVFLEVERSLVLLSAYIPLLALRPEWMSFPQWIPEVAWTLSSL